MDVSQPSFRYLIRRSRTLLKTHFRHIYHMSWFLGLFVSGIVWLVLNTIWPPPDPEQVKDDDVPGPSAFKFGQDDKQVENGTASM